MSFPKSGLRVWDLSLLRKVLEMFIGSIQAILKGSLIAKEGEIICEKNPQFESPEKVSRGGWIGGLVHTPLYTPTWPSCKDAPLLR